MKAARGGMGMTRPQELSLTRIILVTQNVFVSLTFVNRSAELRTLDACARPGGLLVVYGRRRLGKTRLLTHWLKTRHGLYSQAIEGSPELQLEQVFRDLASGLTTNLVPKSWEELFEILNLQRRPLTVCLDEFPYLVSTDASVPSRFQKWCDHGFKAGFLLILAGSSTRMMHDAVLSEGAPLFGRARRVLHVGPMRYADFCRATRHEPKDPDSFLKFALVGGVPKYWEFVRREASAVETADELYFDFAPYMENEPRRILRDEKVEGLSPLTLLEVIGRGAERPSEMASRLGMAQTSLSSVLQRLIAASILEREIPFGDSERNAKRTLYRIADPSIRFWFRVYSPHRSTWRTFGRAEKLALLKTHAGSVFEDVCRGAHPEARRYWEKGLEIDMVRPSEEGVDQGVIVSEIKWKRLSASERRLARAGLKRRWEAGQLSRKHVRANFEVLDWSNLPG